MKEFTGEWQGKVRGTNEGPINLELKEEEGKITGEFKFLDQENGLTEGTLTDMTTDGANLVGRIINICSKAQLVPTQGVFRAHIIENGDALAGQWSTDIGTSGEMTLYKLGRRPISEKEDIPLQEKTIFKLNMRKARIRSCVFTLDNLKTLYKSLQEKVDEACEHEVKYYKSTVRRGSEREQMEKVIQQIKDAFKLSTQIFGGRGEYFFSTDISIFNEQNLPDKIETIIFDSLSPFEFRFRVKPQNGIKIHITHLKTNMLDFGIPTEPSEFENFIEVSGSNDTWVSAVFNDVQDFFNKKGTNRNWLHSKKAYDILIWLVFWPLVFWLLFRFSKTINTALPNLPTVPLIAIHVYIAVISFYAFRFLLNYSKWVFPLIEVQVSKEDKRIKHRKFLYLILGSIFTAFLYDLVKYLIAG